MWDARGGGDNAMLLRRVGRKGRKKRVGGLINQFQRRENVYSIRSGSLYETRFYTSTFVLRSIIIIIIIIVSTTLSSPLFFA